MKRTEHLLLSESSESPIFLDVSPSRKVVVGLFVPTLSELEHIEALLLFYRREHGKEPEELHVFRKTDPSGVLWLGLCAV